MKFNFALLLAAFATATFGVLQIVSADHSEGTDNSDYVVAVTQDANPTLVPLKTYQSTLLTALSSVQDSLLPTLNGLQPAIQTQERTQNQLQLQTVGVGLGLSFNVGLGPLVSTTLTPHLRIIFSNNIIPTYPD